MRRRTQHTAAAALAVLGLAFLPVTTTSADQRGNDHADKIALGEFSNLVPDEIVRDAPCVDGRAFELWACDGVDLIEFFPTVQTSDAAGGDLQANLGRGGKIEISDSWGWTSPDTGDRYVIAGKTNGAAFFRIEEDATGVHGFQYLGDLPNESPSRSVWHDIKVIGNMAYVVAESVGSGMLEFDLTNLDGATEPQTWAPELRNLFTGIESHNVVVNEAAATVYLVGGTVGLAPQAAACRGGLVIAPITETGAGATGCWDERGYVHDAQCLRYDGPDTEHVGKDLCFTANPDSDTMSIVDVTDPVRPVELANAGYPNDDASPYAHQGWLSEDGGYFFFGDESDDDGTAGTRTMIFDVRDLDAVPDAAEWRNPSTRSIDHNLYTHDGLLYQANYSSGLRVLDTSALYDGVTPLGQGSLREIAFFDVYPEHDDSGFVGSWSVYPYFEDGVVAISAYDGLYLVQLHDEVLEQRFTPGS